MTASVVASLLLLLLSVVTRPVTSDRYPEHDRLDCFLVGDYIDKPECLRRGCIWDEVEEGPWCFFNTSRIGYTLDQPVHRTTNRIDASLTLKPEASKATIFKQVPKLNISITFLSEKILRFKIFDPANKRYEVPVVSHFSLPKGGPKETQYDVSLTGGDFRLLITRKMYPHTRFIDTSLNGLIFGDQFLQFVTRLPSKNLYGFGENYHKRFRLDQFDYTTRPIFTRDQALGDKSMNSYGAHPYFMVKEEKEFAYGVLLLNSNAMSYSLIPERSLALKTTGGVLDFFLFMADNPEQLVQVYTSVIGRPILPPFWGLGFQLSRYGYRNTGHVQQVLKRTYDNHIPLDVHYMDIDYMDGRKDFTLNEKDFGDLPSLVNETRTANELRWAFILDPAIDGNASHYRAFQEGYKRDVFIKWPPGQPTGQHNLPPNVPTDKNVLYGKVWPDGPAAFPDFFKNSTAHWWKDMIEDFYHKIPFDALWIDMNEPSNFDSQYLTCPQSAFRRRLISQGFKDYLDDKTICMNARQGENQEYAHYDVHSLYGWSESQPSQKALQQVTGKRGFVVSRSTYPSSSQYVTHWLGDNFSTWPQLRQSIVGMLEFTLFGFTFTGSDICGFNGNTTAELCRRWLQLGAYYPFSRSHNGIDSVDQDPGYWAEAGHPEVTRSAVEALTTRYQMLHYLYTAFYRAHVSGNSVVRSLMHHDPYEPEVRPIDEQFLLGSSVLVCPFLYENQQFLDAYVPFGSWYKMDSNFAINISAHEDHYRFVESESDRPLLLKGGSILPFVSRDRLPVPLNTATLRQVSIDLWVLPMGDSAKGELFYDDGESIGTIEKGEYSYFYMAYAMCQLVLTPRHTHRFGETSSLRVASIKIPLYNHTSFDAKHLEMSMSGVNHSLPVAIHDDGYMEVNTEPLLDLLQVQHEVSMHFRYKKQKYCFLR